MGHKKPYILQNNDDKYIVISIKNHNKLNDIYKNHKNDFADFVYSKTQITWKQFKAMPHERGGFEPVKNNMTKDIPANIINNYSDKLLSSRLNQQYRIIFTREENELNIQFISKHYGDK